MANGNGDGGTAWFYVKVLLGIVIAGMGWFNVSTHAALREEITKRESADQRMLDMIQDNRTDVAALKAQLRRMQ